MASILVRPGLSLSVSLDGPTWAASVACTGNMATKTGFVLRSEAFAWCVETIARFDGFVVS